MGRRKGPWGKRHSNRGLIAVSILFLLTGGPAVLAQLPTATILGVVKDSTGAVVPGATLTARNVENAQSRTALSAGDGSYRLAALPVGTYELRVEHPGFQTEVRSSLTLAVGQEAVVYFSLQVGAVEQTVAVTAEAPLVNTTSGSLASLVNEQKIADLPLNGRNYIDLTLLQPGIAQQVNKNPGGAQIGTWFSSNGAPVRSNNVLLDGAIMTNLYGAGTSSVSGSTLGIDGIREWQVITNSFSAEYGMGMGSQMLLVSKSGANNFHGSAFEFLRNNVLDARNFFDRKTLATSRRLPQFKRNNFGGSFGGPLKKDKTFFYGTYEGLRERLGVTTIDNVLPAEDLVTTNNPGCGGCTVPAVIQPLLALYPAPNLPRNQFTFPFSKPTNENYGQMRGDQNISTADALFARYTIDDAEQLNTAGFPRFTIGLVSRAQYVTLSENHIFSPSLLNSARFSFSRTNLSQTDPPSGLIGPQFSFLQGFEIGNISIGGVSTLGSSPLEAAVKQNIFTWSDDVFKTQGRHALKFGLLINRYQQFINRTSSQKGTISFANIRQFLLGQPSSLFTGVAPGSITDKTYHLSTVGFYAQDDLRIRSGLTFNLGFRYEFSTTYDETRGRASSFRDILKDPAPTVGAPFKNPSLHNFSPRFGFAWDVRGDGKTAVRGGFGLLYDIASFGPALFTGSLSPPFASSSTVSIPASNPVLLELPLVFRGSVAGKSLSGVKYDIGQPNLLQYNLAVERQLPASIALTLAYGGSRGVHLLRTTEGNPTIPQILANGQPFFSGNDPRLNPNFTTFTLVDSTADSWYNSLQAQVVRRMSKGFEFQGSFTWSKLIDTGQGQVNGENTSTPFFPQFPQDLGQERAPASFDATINTRINAIYRFPEFHGKDGVLGTVLNGWGVTGIFAGQSGYPFTPTLQTNRSRSGVNAGATLPGSSSTADRPNLVPGVSLHSITRGVSRGCGNIPAGTPLGTPNLFLDPCAFALQPVGTLGNVGRNSLRGPRLVNLDFAITKDTPLKFIENARIQFRAEFFNILNHTNFVTPTLGGPGKNAAAVVLAGSTNNVTENPLPNAGVLTSTSTTSRQIQFALKLIF